MLVLRKAAHRCTRTGTFHLARTPARGPALLSTTPPHPPRSRARPAVSRPPASSVPLVPSVRPLLTAGHFRPSSHPFPGLPTGRAAVLRLSASSFCFVRTTPHAANSPCPFPPTFSHAPSVSAEGT